MTEPDEDTRRLAASAFDVASWRRAVHDLYAAVRAEPDPAEAHALWVRTRSRLFLDHPASPRLGEQELRHAAYDPAYRFVVPVGPAQPHRWEFTSASDGIVPFERVGQVALDRVGSLDVWWLDSYGGGIFLPIRDASAGTETYGAGRYVLDTVKGADLGRRDDSQPGGAGQSWVVDLNFAYNPSCVYDPRWNCPLAPAGNRVGERAAVGELLPHGYA